MSERTSGALASPATGLRVLHFVPLFSSSAAYGGPTRVSLGQARELTRIGHRVDIWGTYLRDHDAPSEIHLTPQPLLFPSRLLVRGPGFVGLWSTSILRHAWRCLKSYDVVHVHGGREVLTLIFCLVCRLRRVPYVWQTHGMIEPRDRLPVRAVDLVLGRRLLRSASAVLALQEAERRSLHIVQPLANVEIVPNGISIDELDSSRDRKRSADDRPDVLFLARLSKRKRPEVFVEVANLLKRDGVRARFSLVGPDDGEEPQIRAQIRRLELEKDVFLEGPIAYDDVAQRLSRSAVHVLPSVNEPCGRTVMESLALGIPTVTTESCGLAPALRASGAAAITGHDARSIADAVSLVLTDKSAAHEFATNGKRFVTERLAIGDVVRRLAAIYQAAAAAS